ncbi:MAG: bifunctional folylpolyglutamate synthase/dihydrofolate synthase, partial [Lachnospiraceae bacterium]|nr:bifunctional folylpolyglutamate synthase/dihydrofolate synthase [Lachnospiraceae bacterium]
MIEEKAQNYQEAEQFLSEVPKFTSKNPLAETKGFYAFVQKEIEEERLGRIIHIAGTNGKGSVCAFLQQIFLESGYHVGMFTSPHLITTRERFMIDGEMISEELFVEAFCWLGFKLKAYRAVKADYVPTYFERLFFMGMYVFAKAGVDITVLET